ncbi:hypothetical protein [Streptomyces sp. NPDC090022]|uniref:hypothetical protein n=1 Tax=Streptomyces sp. NPDC090022 TaxID=3365920 RepID=UPI00380E30DF
MLAGAAVLCVAGAAPGAAYAAPEPVPAYREADGAKKVAGAASTADAPLIEPGGAYLDTVSPGERFYKLNLDARSSVYVSAVVRPGADAKIGYSDDVEVDVMTTGGKSCPGSPGQGSFQGRPQTVSVVGMRRLQEDADCQEAGVYYVKVTRDALKDSDQSPWPVELVVHREPGLKSGSAPAVAPSGWPSATPAAPADQAVARSGGTGFNDARALGAGVWRDELRPGQTRFYRVPLDWGRQLAVTAELAGAKMTRSSGYASDGLALTLYSPYRGQVGDKDTTYDGKQASVGLGLTPPVAYENRFSTDAWTRSVGVAGWYYVAVTMGPKVGEFTENASPVPLTLRVSVQGQAAAAPPYAESLTAAGFGVGGADLAAAKDGLTAPEAAEAADTRSLMRLVAAGGFGTGAVLLLGLGGWIWLARRGATSG